MCGLCGIISASSNLSIENCVKKISHRGPDELKTHISGFTEFGFARLSINDIEGGSQPFIDSTTGVMVMVNGEVYNHHYLRERYCSDRNFGSNSDCEIVLHLYLILGKSCFSLLDGMFAISIWDPRFETLFLVRDRLGKKPLYWRTSKVDFYFASEQKAIMEKVNLQIDRESVLSFFVSDSVPTPKSIFINTNKLQPGSILEWKIGEEPSVSSFWPKRKINSSLNKSNEFEALRQAIHNSVYDRLQADVPVGILLSSGVDSTLIACYASLLSRKPLDSFTLKFNGNYDESRIARDNAQKLGLKHHDVDASVGELARQVPTMVNLFDEPVNDPAILPMLLLSEFARQKVKVALSGDGGDELLIGYPHARLNFTMSRFHSVIKFMSPAIARIISMIPVNDAYFSLNFKLERFLRGIKEDDFFLRDMAWRSAFSFADALKLLESGFCANQSVNKVKLDLTSSVRILDEDTNRRSQWIWWYLRTYLMDNVLVKVDRASMYKGLEVRSPLLDYKVVETVLSLRSRKFDIFKKNKSMFRKIISELNPNLTIPTSKHGMGVPVSEIIRGYYSDKLREITNPVLLRNQGIFEPEHVAKIVSDFLESRRDLRKEIWGIFVFQLWYERWVGF